MPIQGFDYKGFAQGMYAQAQDLVPQHFKPEHKEYVSQTLLKFATIVGEALDKDGEFTAEQASFITQVIAEWTFHKCVDLVNSGLPRQYWDTIMQKIAMVIFEIAKNAIRQNAPQDQALEAIEMQVKKVYVDSIEELKKKNLIDDDLMEKAVSQSNIDTMAQSAQEIPQETPPQTNQEIPVSNNVSAPKKTAGEINSQTIPDIPGVMLDNENAKKLKLLTVAMLFQRMKQDKVQVILDKMNPDEANDIIHYMELPDLPKKLDAKAVLECLVDFRNHVPPQNLELSPTKIVNKIKAICDYIDRPKLEHLLKPERVLVRRFVFSAIDGEIVKIPPKVACIIANYIENAV